MTQRNRQLAAIVFTDIVGYSSLMRTDERRAMDIRRRHRAIFDTLTPKYGGRILQYYGDGTLSIFNSSVSAVECAVEMQRAFRQDPVVPLRIGIHTGDIAYDDIDVYGDGVNVASRIEPCCIKGGILITGKVFDDIKNHEWLSALDLGSFTFKGIDESIRLYAIDNEGVAVPSEADIQNLRHADNKVVAIAQAPRKKADGLIPEKIRQLALVSIPVLLLGLILLNIFNRPVSPPAPITLSLPQVGGTSIAVLPFDNFSGQGDNDYFSDGITEDILSLLSRIEGLKVVSRSSVMQYKGTDKNIREIGRELNTDHILDGSVRRNGNKVRIVAQLIDARTDNSLWTETYDREITEIFDVQSQVAQDIALALQKKLSANERAALSKKPTHSLQAYEIYLKGREFYLQYTRQGNEQAIALFRKALALDPGFAQAYAGLGDALAQKAFKDNRNSALLDSAIALSSRAIELDQNLSEGYKSLGLAYHYRGWYEKALVQYEKALKRNPNNDMAINNIGAIYQEQGKMLEAIRWTQRALAINPQHTWSMHNLARMYLSIGEEENCMRIVEKGMEQHPDFIPFHEIMAFVRLRQQDFPGARELALKLIAARPNDPLGYQVMGEIALLENKYEDARAFFNEVAQLSESENWETDPLANELNLAYLDIQQGDATVGQTRLRALLRKMTARLDDSTAKKNHLYLSLGMGYAILNEPALALKWLQKAAENNWIDYRSARINPFFRNLRSDPGFRQLLRSMEERTKKLREDIRPLTESPGRMI